MNPVCHEIANDFVSLAVDERGCLVALTNRKTGHNYAGGRGLWRIVYAHDEVLEEEILAEDCRPEIARPAPDRLHLRYQSLRTTIGTEEEFTLSLSFCLDGDTCLCSAELANRSTHNRVIREFDFPTIRNVVIATGQCFHCGAIRIEDIPGEIEKQSSGYVAEDNKAICLPFYHAGMAADGFALLANANDGLYLGDHDPAFELACNLLRKRGPEIDVSIHKSPYLTPGQSRTCGGYVLSPYSGDWHVGARKYRRWADTWFKPLPRPPSLATRFNGWYRLILRHQYGKVLFRYDELPRILKSMKETGIDTLFLFGWHRDGHDAGYPDYACDESQGGKAALQEQIRQFRANGGKLILYFNGRLIDTATDFYRTQGKDLSILGCDGQPLIDRYMFAGPGIDLRHQFGHKSFALACPHSRVWMEVLKRHIDTAIELGADGVFFDQLGFAERPCFGRNHGHPVPMLDGRAVRMAQLCELRDYLKQRRPDMTFGIEHVGNFSCGFADYIHSCPGWNVAANDWFGKAEKPRLTTFIELFRYTFPEILISDREIRDDTDIERRVNLALLRGLVSDVEVHRCRTLIDEAAPHYKKYLVKANRLRDRFRHLILNGRFQDTDGASCDNPELSWSVFTAGDELALVATQSHLETATGTFAVPGHDLSKVDSISGDAQHTWRDGMLSLTLPRHALAVAVFKRGTPT